MSRHLFRMMLWGVFVAVLGMGRGASAQVLSPETLRRALYLPTVRASATAQTSVAVRPTALMGVPIDAEVVKRLLRSRLQDVQSQVLRDVLRGDLALLTECRPCRDLIDAIAALSTQAMDADARSSALSTASLRAGLAFTFAALGQEGVIQTACDAPPPYADREGTRETARMVALANAAYRGLQHSAWVQTLGFRVDTPRDRAAYGEGACEAFAERVQHIADTVARLGTDLHAVTRVVAAATAVRTGCESAALREFVELRAALREVALGEPKSLRVGRLREVRNAFGRARGELVNLAPPAGDAGAAETALVACVQSLQQFSVTFDEVFGRLAADLDADITLEALERDLFSLLDPVTEWERLPGAERFQLTAAALDPSLRALSNAQAGAASTPLVRALEQRRDTLMGHPDFLLIRDVVMRLASRQSLRRSDIVGMAARAKMHLDRILAPHAQDDRRWALVKRLVDAVLDAVPQSIIEDDHAPGGLRLDVPGLVATLTSEFAQQDRVGFYVRATVGAGYAIAVHGATTRPFYEEIGVGWRWSFGNQRFLGGPQLVTSGLLYQLQDFGGVGAPVFVGAGGSINFYRLVDLSANVGILVDARDNGESPRLAFTVGLQLPLIDYIQALTSGSGTTSSTTTRGGSSP